MSHTLLDHIRTVIAPWVVDVLGRCTVWISTPWSVSLRNLRSTAGQATVASRPTG